jgi:Sulfotransferase family
VIPDAPIMIERAQSSTGLSDFGADGWQEGLERLVQAARSDLDLEVDEATAARLQGVINQRLTSRLRMEDWYGRQESEPPPLEGLIIIHGLPRTGTTALQYLLSKDPKFRYPRRWEATSPVPPPGTTSDANDERRLAALKQAQGATGGSTQHISEVDGPSDDGVILGLDFHNQETGLPLPTYTRWWRSSSLKTTYAYHERVLRLLHTGHPPNLWVVKAPYHNFHLSDMAAQYPQARFVMTHRDPAISFPSACSTVFTAQRNALPKQPPDPVELGAFLLEHLVAGVTRAMADRSAIGEDRFLDVSQSQLEADAVGTVERIYDFSGLELDNSARASMGEWAVNNRRGARGEHRYSAEEYGLTTEEIRSAFADYIERFNVALEV